MSKITENSRPTLYILRGPPGSGKSRYASVQFPNVTLFEADQFYMKTGEYVYNPKQAFVAHMWCQKQVKQTLEQGLDCVVANTFITRPDLLPYIKLQDSLSTHPRIEIYELLTRFSNIHNVPQASVTAMEKKYQSNDKIQEHPSLKDFEISWQKIGE